MHKNYFEGDGIHLTFVLRGNTPEWNKQNNKQGWQWLVKDECDERDDKRDERDDKRDKRDEEREHFWLYSFRGTFTINWSCFSNCSLT